MPPNHLILCHPLLLPPSSFPASGSFQMSQFFASGGQSIGSFSFTISTSNEHPGLISFRMDWLDLLAVQGTLKSLLQHHSSKASILWCSAFFIVQLSHPYMTTGKTKALRWTFVGKVMSLFFNMLSRLVITFHYCIYEKNTTKLWVPELTRIPNSSLIKKIKESQLTTTNSRINILGE